jgi:hypothetical protein
MTNSYSDSLTSTGRVTVSVCVLLAGQGAQVCRAADRVICWGSVFLRLGVHRHGSAHQGKQLQRYVARVFGKRQHVAHRVAEAARAAAAIGSSLMSLT